jgi:hypothetical protein
LRALAVLKAVQMKLQIITPMKTKILFSLLTIAAGALLAADSSPKDEVTSAAKMLSEKDNYSWKSTMEFGNFSTTTAGKIDKEGVASLSMSVGDNTREAVLKGSKGAVKTPNEGWQSLSELESATEGGRGRQFLVRRLQNFKMPAEEAANLAAKTKEIKKEGDSYSGELTEAGAKELLSRGRGRGGNAPEAKNAKGSVKFWIKDGLLSKYELKQQGSITVNGDERDIEGTTTVEIKDVGTTKVEVPEEAKKKLS